MVVFVLVDSHLCNELDRDTHIEIFLIFTVVRVRVTMKTLLCNTGQN